MTYVNSKIVILSALTLSSSPVYAILTNVQDYGDYFLDQVTRMDWLDVSITSNKSYNYVSSQLGAGGKYEGWRYATAYEWGQMLDNITNIDPGITGPGQLFRSENDEFDEIINMVGSTLDDASRHNPSQGYLDYDTWWRQTHCYGTVSTNVNCDETKRLSDYTRGMVADHVNADTVYVAYLVNNDLYLPPADILDRASTETFRAVDEKQWATGSWLVRPHASVPEPASLQLLGLTLLGLIVMRRRKSTVGTS